MERELRARFPVDAAQRRPEDAVHLFVLADEALNENEFHRVRGCGGGRLVGVFQGVPHSYHDAAAAHQARAPKRWVFGKSTDGKNRPALGSAQIAFVFASARPDHDALDSHRV